jgi:hypothetical protein
MAFTLEHLEIDDYDTWKREVFDKDPARRSEIAKRHQVFRGVEDPRQVFIGVEFESVDDATSFRERLLASGALEGIKVKTQSTVVDVADTAEY